MNGLRKWLTILLAACALAACGGGGGGGEPVAGGGTQAPAPDGSGGGGGTPGGTLGLSLATTQAQYLSGSLLQLNLNGATATGLTATVGGVEVPVVESQGAVLVKLPALAAGDHVLKFSQGNNTGEVPIKVEVPALAQAPTAFVTQLLDALVAQVQAMPTADLSAEEATQLQERLKALTDARASVGGMTDAQVKELAYSLAAGGFGIDGSFDDAVAPLSALQIDLSDQCYALGKQHVSNMMRHARLAGLAVGFGLIAYGAPNPITIAAAAVVTAKLLVNVKRALANVDELLKVCITDFGNAIVEEISQAQGAATPIVMPTMAFTNDVAKTFRFRQQSRLPDEIVAQVKPSAEQLAALLDQLPGFARHAARLRAFADDAQTAVAPASRYTVRSVSDPRIEVTLAPAGSNVGVTARFKTPPTLEGTTQFSFELARVADGGSAGVVPATLTYDSGCNADLQARLRAAVLGNWSVTYTADGSVSRFEVYADGTGAYLGDDGTRYPIQWKIARWNEPLPSPFSNSSAPLRPLGVAPGCVFVETGFWHYAYNGLVRSNLQLPLTGFSTYPLGGPFGWPASLNYFGHDLSPVAAGLVYRKQ